MRRSVLYSDFNCPFCYAMHERLHDSGLMQAVEWRGVQHAPHLPTPMQRWSGHLGAELRQEVTVVRRLAPELSIVVPKGKPNTRAAIEAAIRALRMDAAGAAGFIRSLYRLFWVEGKDISDPEILQEAGQRQGFEPGRIASPSAEDVSPIVERWAAGWADAEHAGVPLLEREDRCILVGLVAVEEIQGFLAHH
ncbi:MAG: DsbA family protein [Nitrospiraceae bacterium]|nr:DsbA family protein [Nitrospiraceae bacterium]